MEQTTPKYPLVDSEYERKTKELMGYTEEKKVCQNCKFCDNSDYTEYCTFNPLAVFVTRSDASCNKFTKRKAKQYIGEEK